MQSHTSTSGSIKSSDDTELYYVKDIPLHPKALILLVHGFGEHLGRYEYVKDKLLEYGYGVIRVDNRGHGKSGGERGHIEDFKDFARDLDDIVRLIRRENSDIPIFMLGHSMGGFIAVLYGILYKNKLAGQILSAAATSTPSHAKGGKMAIAKFINKFFPKIRMANPLVKDLEKNNEDILILKSATINFYIEFLVKGIEWIRKNLINYEYPCLILHGSDDNMVYKEASIDLHSSISSTDKQIKVYEGLYHELLKQKDRDKVLYDIHIWIEEKINNR